MKSKIYSSRYMKISSKGMIWIPAFVTIGFLLAFPVTELIMLGNWFGMEYTAEQISLLYENLWRNGFMVSGLAVAALAALFNGISQFWYLYSPRKIDFYHSLPVKRSRMFWYKSLQSLLYFLLPYLVMEFFSVCIGAMRGFFSLHLMKMAFVMLVFHLLLYLLLYFSVVLVICITGHLLMGALLLVAAAAYGPVFSVLLDLYERAFYYTRSESSYCLVKVLKELISPVALAYTFVKKYAEGNYGGMLIAVLLVTAVLGGLGYCAFVHRKSERTGMAFVFPWAGTAVKFLVVVSGGLGIGFVFYMLSNDSSRTIWWIFGLILGMIIAKGRMSKFLIIQMPIRFFLLIMRGTPLILQLYGFYFGLYYVAGLSLDRMTAAVISFSLNYAAYFAEIYRSGIQAIPKGQYEAAKVLGFNRSQTFFKIILPQVVKIITPSLGSECMTLVKDTSLAHVIGVMEIYVVATNQMARSRGMIYLVVAGIFYLIMNAIVSKVFSVIEKRMNYYR